MKRSCGACNKCCEGWLYGEVQSHQFRPGCACHFLTEGKCSIYQTRPDNPCKSYNCEWLIDENIPGWMKPSNVNALFSKRNIEGIEYYSLIEAGETLRSDVLSWVFIYCLNKQLNLEYQIKGGKAYIGSSEFLSATLNGKTRL